MEAWMRVLFIRFSNSKSSLVFGTQRYNAENNFDDLSISVVGTKQMSCLKDSCTVKIVNLTYAEIVTLITGKFYDVEVWCGYEKGAVIKIFEGGVSYISSSLDSEKNNVCTILCASKLVAKFGQARINLSLHSGINMYAATKYICKRAGVNDSNVSQQLKKTFINNVKNAQTTSPNMLDALAKANDRLVFNADSSNGSSISVFDISRGTMRVIPLKEEFISLSGGFPQLTTEGLFLSVTPTFDFMPGDTIQLDNSLIQMRFDTLSSVSSNLGMFIDDNGQYMIRQLDFSLQNRGPSFSINLHCKSMQLMKQLISKGEQK